MAASSARAKPDTLLADAIELGLTKEEREQKEIADAFEVLRERTAQRVLSGETRPADAWDEVLRSLTVLLTTPSWIPTNCIPSGQCRSLIEALLQAWERIPVRATMNPNPDGAVTRAALRLFLAEASLILGAASPPDCSGLGPFSPWKPREGLGRVVRDFTHCFQPRLTREQIIKQLAVTSPPVWDRLLRGELPATVGFDYDRFVDLAAGDPEAKLQLKHQMQRAFALCRLVENLRKLFGPADQFRDFWTEAWPELARIFRVAHHQATLDPAGTPTQRLDAARIVAASGTHGLWRHALGTTPGDWLVHLETVANAAGVITASNAPRPKNMTMDDLLLVLLDGYRNFPEAQIVEQARAAAGTPEAVRLLCQLPPTPANLVSLGRELMTQGRPDEARHNFEAAMHLAPDDWDAVGNLAWFETVHGDASRALALLSDGRFSDRPDHPFHLGETLFRLGRPADAFAAFQDSIKRQHAIGPSHARAAECLRLMGDKPRSEAYAKTAARLSGINPLDRI